MHLTKSLAQRMTLFALCIVTMQAFNPAITVKAATANTLYSYQFGSSTVSVPNDAATNTNLPLTLQGNVTTSASGKAVYFDGNTINKSSVGYAKPTSGATMSATQSESYGASIKFTHTLVAGETCFADSHNYTQIGRFGTGLSQLKIQASNCHTNSRAVFPECRVAAASNGDSAPIVRGTQPLVNGATYIVSCIKAPDVAKKSSILLITARVDLPQQYVTTDSFQTQAAGAFYSNTWLSVGNKYTLPKQSANTDQVVGDIYHVSYCKASATYAVQACLETDNPTTPTPTPTPDPYPVPTLAQFVQNTGIENDTTGWNKVWGSNVVITQDTSIAHSGNSSLKAVYTGPGSNNVGIKDSPFTVEKAVKGLEYTANVWVKSSSNGKVIELRLREMSGAETIATVKTTVSASSAGWTKHTAHITPLREGSSISFALTSYSSASSSTFWADDFSLTATNT